MADPERVEAQPRWTTEIYYKGFRILLTQPFANAGAIVSLMENLVKLGFTPDPNDETKPQLDNVKRTEMKEAGKKVETPICPMHNTPMVQREGQYGKFWSCPTKMPDDTFCKYRPPKR